MAPLSHLDEQGQVRMVDVSAKPGTLRTARAEGSIHLLPATLAAITSGQVPKGNVLTAAKLAGIQAAKETARLIPLCHPLALSWVDIEFELGPDRIRLSSVVKAKESTGPEMEALMAVSTAALTIYDMCKAIDRQMRIGEIRLLGKSGGQSEHAANKPHGTAFRPRTGIVILSDSVAAGQREDASGQILTEGFKAAGCEIVEVVALPDEPDQLVATARRLLSQGVELLVTSGGTGLGPRDRTIAALEPLLESRLPGVEQALHAYGRARVPAAMLSRLVAGTVGQSIVVCLPGNPTAASDALQVLVPTLFHAYDIMKGGGHDS
ncbi:MAG: bifunctional molybdenum cofactor biosynthesis protein MoaC/MoaB [Candidatus Marinimicrobia bacterium]|nr:bifunctional molybdenum cofactor biosynthesis protein MoaC/MoaB [Candidatus Neomarinimicrobiota bacterium]